MGCPEIKDNKKLPFFLSARHIALSEVHFLPSNINLWSSVFHIRVGLSLSSLSSLLFLVLFAEVHQMAATFVGLMLLLWHISLVSCTAPH